jgi:hypothetical protein
MSDWQQEDWQKDEDTNWDSGKGDDKWDDKGDDKWESKGWEEETADAGRAMAERNGLVEEQGAATTWTEAAAQKCAPIKVVKAAARKRGGKKVEPAWGDLAQAGMNLINENAGGQAAWESSEWQPSWGNSGSVFDAAAAKEEWGNGDWKKEDNGDGWGNGGDSWGEEKKEDGW